MTPEQIKRLCPTAHPKLVAAIVDNWAVAQRVCISSKPNRIHDFMANIAVETGGLRGIVEVMNYSAKRLCEVWPSRFPSIAAARPYANNPEALANKTYGGRLGNKQPGDGWRYIGRGMMQTTGRDNYRALGFENNPNALEDPRIAFETAVREWQKRGCSALSDAGDMKAVRKAINGGLNGYEEYLKYRAKAQKIWTDIDTPVAPAALPPADAKIITDVHRVKVVQQWLRNLGYAEVGPADGEIGEFTKGAIRDYRANKGLPLGDYIDDQLFDTLATDKEPRKLDPKRTEASPGEVKQKIPEAAEAGKAKDLSAWGKVCAQFTAIFAAVAGVIDAIVSKIPYAENWLAPIKGLLGSVDGWVWFLLVAGVAIAAYILTRKTEEAADKAVDASVDAFREGARR